MKTRRTIAAITVTLVLFAGLTFERVAAAPSDISVTPGEFVVEHPTLINLGFEWQIDGDANRNASVAIGAKAQSPERAFDRGASVFR